MVSKNQRDKIIKKASKPRLFVHNRNNNKVVVQMRGYTNGKMSGSKSLTVYGGDVGEVYRFIRQAIEEQTNG